jgi:hypothetical protein
MERILLSESRCTPFVSGEHTSSVLTVGQTVLVRPFNPRRRTTTVEFQGRLGNVLFGYAAGLTVQSRRGGELRFLHWRTPSTSDFLAYVDPDGVDGIADLLRGFRPVTGRRLTDKIKRRIIRQLRTKVHRIRVGVGEMHRFRQSPPFAAVPEDLSFSAKRKVLFVGFFQHPSWYEPSLDVVTEKIWSTVSPHVNHLLGVNSTVISVRLGDYVEIGWDLAPAYYERAIAALGPIEGPIWITSDEPEVAQAMLEPILKSHGLTVDSLPVLDLSGSMRDFTLLCVARNVIMSNSTYCWWGTVTGQMQGNQGSKRVICPSPWIATYPNSDVLIRPDWTVAEAEFGNRKV